MADLMIMHHLAMRARDRAYAPYSGFPVGAAVETADGSVFVGCNVENRAYPQTLCAERNAIGAAIAAGHKEIRRLYVVADPLATPCGACRSVIAELGSPDAEIVCATPSGESRTFTVDELLPFAFERDADIEATIPAGGSRSEQPAPVTEEA